MRRLDATYRRFETEYEVVGEISSIVRLMQHLLCQVVCTMHAASYAWSGRPRRPAECGQKFLITPLAIIIRETHRH